MFLLESTDNPSGKVEVKVSRDIFSRISLEFISLQWIIELSCSQVEKSLNHTCIINKHGPG
jgi:hypothetical protein